MVPHTLAVTHSTTERGAEANQNATTITRTHTRTHARTHARRCLSLFIGSSLLTKLEAANQTHTH